VIAANGERIMANVSFLSKECPRAEVVEHLLQRGIMIEAWAVVSLIGLQLLSIEARVVTASLDGYLRYADALGKTAYGIALPLQAAPKQTGSLLVAPRTLEVKGTGSIRASKKI
jgi:gas vesicle structural protein